jgi:hypothetical protein
MNKFTIIQQSYEDQFSKKQELLSWLTDNVGYCLHDYHVYSHRKASDYVEASKIYRHHTGMPLPSLPLKLGRIDVVAGDQWMICVISSVDMTEQLIYKTEVFIADPSLAVQCRLMYS